MKYTLSDFEKARIILNVLRLKDGERIGNKIEFAKECLTEVNLYIERREKGTLRSFERCKQ